MPNMENSTVDANQLPSVRVPDTKVMPLDDWNGAIEIIALISNMTVDEARDRLEREQKETGYNVRLDASRWNFERYVWSDRLTEFYKRSHAFLFESFIYNRSAGKELLRRRIAEFLREQTPRPQRILVFGDGLGFDSAYLALAGHSVDYFEVSESGRKFARTVFVRNGLEIQQILRPEDIGTGVYDVVVCLDVLEHVQQPKSVVALISGALCDDGHLIVHAPFWYVAPEVPTHLQGNRQYSGDWIRLYRPFGLYPVQALSLWMPIILKKTKGNREIALFRRLKIGVVGYLLALARWWNGPFVMIARLATKQSAEKLARK